MKPRTRMASLVLLLLVVANLPAAGKPYQSIDRHALEAPAEVERNIPDLTRYLIEPAKNDTEKVRAICRWIADRVNYDNDLKDRALKAYAAGKYPPELVKEVQAENVLRVRKTVCEGYANLFVSLCKQAGVEAVRIGGEARAFKGGHSWNAVKLDGQWQLLDLTGMAAGPGTPRAGKPFHEFYFLTPPDQLIFFYRPTDPKWQLLQPAISKQAFEQKPPVNFLLFQFGFSGKDVLDKLKEKDFRGFVNAGFLNGGRSIKLLKAPLERHLKSGDKYLFRVETGDYLEVFVANEGQFQQLERKGNVFEGAITGKRGSLKLGGKRKEGDKDVFDGMLEYVVE